MQKFIITVLAIGFIVSIGAAVGLIGGTADTAIVSIEVDRPSLIIRGRGLERVEVWADPAGIGGEIKDPIHIGTAEEIPSRAQGALWTVGIPNNPLSLSRVYAKGYSNGELVGEVSLPQKTPTDIYDALWGNRNL